MPALHASAGPMHEINIVPYIDVMLVLLVIFMVTAPLITPAVIDLPTRRQGGPAARRAARGLRQGRPRAGRARARRARARIVSERTISRSELADAIKQVRGKNADLAVLVGGDKDARYEAVLQVMDELRKQGVTRVGLQVKLVAVSMAAAGCSHSGRREPALGRVGRARRRCVHAVLIAVLFLGVRFQSSPARDGRSRAVGAAAARRRRRRWSSSPSRRRRRRR